MFVEVIYTVLFPFKCFVINVMCVICIRMRSVLLKITSDLGSIHKILFKLTLAYLYTTVTLQNQLIDNKKYKVNIHLENIENSDIFLTKNDNFILIVKLPKYILFSLPFILTNIR